MASLEDLHKGWQAYLPAGFQPPDAGELKLADAELDEVSTLNRAVALVERKVAAKSA